MKHYFSKLSTLHVSRDACFDGEVIQTVLAWACHIVTSRFFFGPHV